LVVEWRVIMQGRVLQIGAGGIGCELLKLLVMSGCTDICLLDLDNIDVSNLNRQFLFRPEHVGQSKAQVAAQVVTSYRPGVLITPIQAPVQRFGPDFFQPFQVVFNALDNDEARRHVNRICAYLKKPLIEAGTQGFLGQVSVHFPPVTGCFECEPRAMQKTYAVCTIRSTPDKPVHCIVWAKYLYEALFGVLEDSNILSDVVLQSPTDLAIKLFSSDITQSKAEVPKRILDSDSEETHSALQVFLETCQHCATRSRTAFDKDDDWALRFVWSASSLRAFNFLIPQLSLFTCKAIAGNIIPAVASTNGIAAGIQVAEAIKLVQAHELAYRSVWINEFKSSKGALIIAGNMPTPRKECLVCNGSVVKLELRTDLAAFSLGQLVGKVLKAELSMQSPTICFGEALLYESGTDLEEETLEMYETLCQKRLFEFGITTDSVLTCDVSSKQDFSQQYKVELWLKNDSSIGQSEAFAGQFQLSGSREVLQTAEGEAKGGLEEDSDFEIVEPTKRPRPEEDLTETLEKKGKWSVISVD